MAYPYCVKYGFDVANIKSRLLWLDLSTADHSLASKLHSKVIEPHAGEIINDFYSYLGTIKEARQFLGDAVTVKRLKETQQAYLMNLGINFDRPEYFESRLRVGQAHAWIGLSLSLYQCSYRLLTQLIIDRLPKNDGFNSDQMRTFIHKITSLDMSLAIETYHFSQVRTLEESLGRAQDQENKLRIEASTDALTGLFNREYILATLKRTLEEDAMEGRPTSAIMADLDHFKEINDTHGHLVGDKVLMEVSRRLGAALRDFDNLGRYGGEEFLIVLKGTSLSTAIAVAERVRAHISAGPVSLHGEIIDVSISLGVSVVEPGDTPEDIVMRADKALYEAKAAGRNCVKSAKSVKSVKS